MDVRLFNLQSTAPLTYAQTCQDSFDIKIPYLLALCNVVQNIHRAILSLGKY